MKEIKKLLLFFISKKGRFTKKWRVDRTDLLKRNKSKDDECTAEEALALLEDSSDDVFENINPATVSDNIAISDTKTTS